MLSKGIMVLALLALVYLLLITMNNKPTEHFNQMKNSSDSTNKKNDKKPRRIPINRKPFVNPPLGKPSVKNPPKEPSKEPSKPSKEPSPPVTKPPAKKLPEENFQVVDPVFPKSSKYIAPVTENFTNQPVINYQENFEEDDVPQSMSELMIDREVAEEYNLQFTNNFYQDSKKGKNIKNPVLDVRGECEIAFNANFTPFNSSAIAGEPLRDVTLLQGDVDNDCKIVPSMSV